jgi:uncharacterized membrane protein YkvA (DUF1232 family)
VRISFEISERDLRYFRDRLRQVRKSKSSRAEQKVILGATKLVAEVAAAEPPEFVRERIEKLTLLTEMVRDREWRLEGPDRTRVLDALAYFVDPDDIIPDRVPGLGYLDDAIMVELVVRELQHELAAYQDFCTYRDDNADLEDPEASLEKRRTNLQARMRRRRHRERGLVRSATKTQRSPFRLW